MLLSTGEKISPDESVGRQCTAIRRAEVEAHELRRQRRQRTAADAAAADDATDAAAALRSGSSGSVLRSGTPPRESSRRPAGSSAS